MVPAGLAAQQRQISFDLRGGYSLPFGDFGDNAGNDWGFGVGGVLTLTPAVGVYAGWGRDSFTCEAGICADDSQLHASGLEAGAKFILPSSGRALPWAKVGIVYHKVEFDGDLFNFESDRNLGFQAGIGIDYPLGEVLSVSPGVRVTLFDVGNDDDFFPESQVRYVNIDIAAHIHLPRN
jgi:opacity protein-like surface antigen